MLYPTLNEVTELLNEYKRTPVFCEVLSDTCTPIHIYNALESKEENCFMLESVDNSQHWGRYSFIGIHPKAEIKVKHGTITHGGVSFPQLSKQTQTDRRTNRIFCI